MTKNTLWLSNNKLTDIPVIGILYYRVFLKNNSIKYINTNLHDKIIKLFLGKNQIRKIENIPKNVSFLGISYNNISEIENIPTSISRLYISNNKISSIKNLENKINLLVLDLSHNSILTIENLPNKLQELYINHNKVIYIKMLPTFLVKLDISYNNITDEQLPIKLPETLRYINISGNLLTKIDIIHKNIDTILADQNMIVNIYNLPENLKELSIFSNRLKIIHNLPNKIIHLNICDNQITSIVNLPEKLSSLCMVKNNIIELPEFICDTNIRCLDTDIKLQNIISGNNQKISEWIKTIRYNMILPDYLENK
jgi:Leucine-rich repeat (LRR) protein